MDDTFTHRRIDCGEVTLHVAEAKPEGADDTTPLVILLHGFPEFWWSWRHQLAALAKAGIWAVAPDLRGYNESDRPESVASYEVERLAGDVAGLIRSLGRTRATVVGHDWGAIVAWSFAQEYPEMLERLAILNVPHPLTMIAGLRRPEQMRKSWYVFFFQLPFLPERFITRDDFAYVRRTFAADGVPPADAERYIDAFKTPGAVTAAVAYYRASVRRVFTGRVPKTKRIDAPVLVIWGEKDRYLGSEMARPPERFVPNATVVLLPDASHWVQNAEPERVSTLLVDFVQSR